MAGLSRIFRTSREAKRQVLLDAVGEIRETLIAGADQAETLGTLPEASGQADPSDVLSPWPPQTRRTLSRV